MKILFCLLGVLLFYINFAEAGEESLQESAYSSLTDESLPIDTRLDSLKELLKKGICEGSVSVFSFHVIKDSSLNVRIRDEVFELTLKFCSEEESFIQKITSLAVEPKLEWSLKKEAVLFIQNQKICRNEITDHLLKILYSPINRHIRNDIIWILSDVPKDCNQKIISSLSQFVHSHPFQSLLAYEVFMVFKYIDLNSIPTISNDLADFRSEEIQSVLWSLVRLGVRNQNINAVVELKKIAMKADMNEYYRIVAVEALQDLSLYIDSAAQALYEIVRDSKSHLDPVNYSYNYDYYRNILQSEEYQARQEEHDAQVRERAFFALAELVENDTHKFLSFLFVDRNLLNYDQVYRHKAFADQPIPENLDLYARPALIKLANDPKVELKPEHRQLVNTLLSGHGNQ